MGQQSPDTLLPLWEAMAKAQWVVLRFDTDEDAKHFCKLAGDTFHLIHKEDATTLRGLVRYGHSVQVDDQKRVKEVDVNAD